MKVTLSDGRGQRILSEGDWPLLIGGPESAVLIPGLIGGSGPIALLAVEGSGLFVQAIPFEKIVISVNGQALKDSRWLHDGDVVMIGGEAVEVSLSEGFCEIAVRGAGAEPDTTPPLKEQRPEPAKRPVARGNRVAPVMYQPQLGIHRPESRGRRPWLWLAMVLALVGLCLAAIIVLSARTITIETSPPAEWATLEGRWPAVHLGDEFLVLPGTYRLAAGRSDYQDLVTQLVVSRGKDEIVRADLAPEPGKLDVRTDGVTGADVLLDGVHVGTTPVFDIEVTQGEHVVEVLAPRHQAFSTTLMIVDPAEQVDIDVDLIEAWAPLTITSRPSGASISLDGQAVGLTPTTVEAGSGSRLLRISRDGFISHEQRVTVVAGKSATVEISLQRAPAVVFLRTQPSGATVTVDSNFRGVSPLNVELSPGTEHEIRAGLAGFEASSRSITLQAGEKQTVNIDLTPQTGRIELIDMPKGAVVTVDGVLTETTDGKLDLLAVTHMIEVSTAQGEPFRVEVIPQPGVTQRVRIQQSVASSVEPPAEEVAMPFDAKLRLVRPGRFTMGAPRREPGRKANEVLREVEITRPYYLGTREVTNREYRKFNSGHLSGKIGSSNLEIDHHPVVRVTWSDAARYCNWLSERQGFDPVYAEVNGRMIARSPLPNGFRLPTEAEWAWAARHPGGAEDRKYGWGDKLPIPAGAGNFGDATAETLLGESIVGYNDGVVATAPAGSFDPNEVGVFNLAGNVAEWVHDVYEVRAQNIGIVEKDPKGPAEGEYHVIRGASYMSDRVTELRFSVRNSGKERRPDLGFRIARFAD